MIVEHPDPNIQEDMELSDITTAKRLIASHSQEGARLLGAGVFKPCYQGRYNLAAQTALQDPEAGLSPEERELIAGFIVGEDNPGTRNRFIRNLDESLYRRVAGRAAERGINIGEAINEAMALWLEI